MMSQDSNKAKPSLVLHQSLKNEKNHISDEINNMFLSQQGEGSLETNGYTCMDKENENI